MADDLRHWIILGVLSAMVIASQQAWIAWEKELYAQMKARKGFLGITQGFPLAMLTDHENIVRVQNIPVERLQERIFRWWSEATRGHAHFEHRSGKAILIAIADGISRNVEERDVLPRLDENPGLFSTAEYEDLVEESEWEEMMMAQGEKALRGQTQGLREPILDSAFYDASGIEDEEMTLEQENERMVEKVFSVFDALGRGMEEKEAERLVGEMAGDSAWLRDQFRGSGDAAAAQTASALAANAAWIKHHLMRKREGAVAETGLRRSLLEVQFRT